MFTVDVKQQYNNNNLSYDKINEPWNKGYSDLQGRTRSIAMLELPTISNTCMMQIHQIQCEKLGKTHWTMNYMSLWYMSKVIYRTIIQNMMHNIYVKVTYE